MVVSDSLAFNATDIMDSGNLATELEAQIKINLMLIDMVRKLSIHPIVLAYQ